MVGLALPMVTPHPPDNNTGSANKSIGPDGPGPALSGPPIGVLREVGEGMAPHGVLWLPTPTPPPSPPTPQAPIFFQALAFLIFMHLSKHRQGTPHHDKYDKSSFESSFHSPPPPERHSLRNHGSMAHTSNVCLVFMGTAF